MKTLDITNLSDHGGGNDLAYTRYRFEQFDSLFVPRCVFQVFFQGFNVLVQVFDDGQVIYDHSFGRPLSAADLLLARLAATLDRPCRTGP